MIKAHQESTQQATPYSDASPQPVIASRGWHASIRAGNANYRAARYQLALRCYREAVRQVDQQLADTAMNVPLLLAKAITLQNAAATYARLLDTDAAEQTYREIHVLLRGIAIDPQQPPGLRATALQQCRLTLWEWSALRETHADEENVIWH